MKPPVFYQTRYVVRLRQLATSARLIDPSQSLYGDLHAAARALEAAVRAEAPGTTRLLIERCQAVLDELAEMDAPSRSKFSEAVVDDGTVALRRLSASVRGVDPGD